MVQNAYVATRVCSPARAKALAIFLGLGKQESPELQDANSMLGDEVVDQRYLRRSRISLGLKPNRGAAMQAVTDSLGSVASPQGMIEEGVEEGVEK
ncbi:hypothetical protein GCM10011578_014170 [Streptomyces fuscichromogenes]|uniref:Uncharacterized protein n=1 Tax=Streptomyces fuscichromogenes TaxID=1324013 RepID=A0A917UHT5_9ACTN|nr:hypothetical protein GCM10011578_014170 [Streptomyces fuscichromogenes]